MPRPIPTDLLLYELPHYPSNATRADFQDARFDRSDLTGADPRGATADGLTLTDCPADGADFRGAHWED